MDTVSLQRIDTLHPALRDNVINILKECDRVLTGRSKVRITEATRTIPYQDGLYALGRTKVNPNGKSASRPLGYKVTNAKGGESIHNYGLALDFCLIIDGKEASWDDTKDWDGDGTADWMEVVAIFERNGWTWGGRWSSFIDKPHFEKTFGFSLSQLKELHKDKYFIPGTTFIDIKPSHLSDDFKETTARVNLRKGPGLEYLVVKTLDRRLPVYVREAKLDWSRIEVVSTGELGWVSNKYIK